MSYHTLSPKPLNVGLKLWLKRGGHIGLGLGAFAPVLAMANPTGGHVVAGSATITTPSANGTVVSQTSQNAIINWQQFNIGSGQYVQFLQPSSSSVVLNRVIGGGGSSILGNLTGNGQIFLVNTNGVFFGKGASVDAQGFLASTLDITDSNFLNHNFVFNKSGSDAQIVNQGNITAHQGGYVVLAGDYAENDGVIAAQSGHVVLASGAKSTLTLNGNSLVSYAVNQATLAQLAGVDNAGKLQADGGAILMTADVANLLKATVVNNSGLVEARAISKAGGTIQLLATGGNIINAGTLNAAAMKAGLQGGDITLKGDGRTTLTNTSKIYATGLGAKGGNLEVSGNTINVRGMAALGRGGNLLLDPGSVTITSGSTFNGGGPPGGSSATAGTGHIGVKFIQTQLNNNTTVHITAGEIIHASSHVSKITATGTGDLDLLVGHGGQIDLAGVTIDIVGDLNAAVYNAFASGSHSASMNFGRIKAKAVDISAGTGSVHLTKAVTVNGTLNPSIKATGGNITIRGNQTQATATASASLNLNATGGNIDLFTAVNNTGNVSITAGNMLAASVILSGKNATLSAKHYQGLANSLEISAASNLTVKGAMGSSASHMGESITLKAGKTITLDHGIHNIGTSGSSAAGKNIHIIGKQLAYTGKGELSISAGLGSLFLDASIGSAAKPVAYGVKLVAHHDSLFLERSIYTKGSISAQQTGSHFSSNFSGTHMRAGKLDVGNSDGKAIVLSARGPITLQGGQVNIGLFGTTLNTGTIKISADDGNAATHTDTLKITATHSGTSGGVFIHEAAAIAFSSGAITANKIVDHSITLNAGQDVDISGFTVALTAATAFASLDSTAVSATAKTNVSITAGNDINLAADTKLSLHGGAADVASDADINIKISTDAEANVSLKAGHDVNLSASSAKLSAGNGTVFSKPEAHHLAIATADARLTIAAGHDISVLASGITVQAGSVDGGDPFDPRVQAVSSGAKAVGIAHEDVSLTAGSAITLTGNMVKVHAGDKVAGQYTHSGFVTGIGSSVHYIKHNVVNVDASAVGAVAEFTATGNVLLKAGSGGITLNGGSSGVFVSGGNDAARGIAVSANDLGGKASVDVQASVTFTTTGNIELKGKHVSVQAGNNAAASIATHSSGTHSGGGFSHNTPKLPVVDGLAGGSAKLTVDASVTLKAGGDFSASATGDLSISAGSNTAFKAEVDGKTGTASLTADASLGISGNHVTLKAGGANLYVGGGSGAGAFADVFASNHGTAKLVADGTVGISAKSAFTASLTGAGPGGNLIFYVNGGAANDAVASASHQGTATIAADDSVKVNVSAGTLTLTTGTRTSNSTHPLKLDVYGNYAASSAFASASEGGIATVTGKGNMTLSATGAVKVAASNGLLDIFTSSYNAGGAGASAFGAGAKASVAAEDVVTIIGGSVSLKAGTPGMAVFAGRNHLQSVHALGSSAGVAAITAKSNVAITAAGAFTATAAGAMSFFGGSHDASNAKANANHGGTALLSDDASLSVKAASIALTAGSSISIYGGYRKVAYKADASGSNAGKASITAKSQVDITATGKFSATAGNDLKIYGGAGSSSASNAVDAKAKGFHHGQASLQVDTSVSIKGGSVDLAASSDLHVVGASFNLGKGDSAFASDFGNASVIADGMVNITAAKAFSAKLNGSSANHNLEIHGGSEADSHAQASAQHHGMAALAASNGVNIAVTGAGGTITINTGNQTNASISIAGFDQNAQSAFAYASHGATAAIAAKDSVTLKATGNISIKTGAGGSVSIFGGFRDNGYNASASANGHSADAAVTVSDSVNISGANVTISAGKQVDIYAGYSYNGAHSASNHSPGVAGGALADNNGKATVGVDVGLNINATGAFTAKGSHMSIFGGYEYNGQSASVDANHGAAAAYNVKDAVSITAGGNVSLTTTTGGLSIYGGYEYNGSGATLKADNQGTAVFGIVNSVTITTKGTFTANAAHALAIYGNSFYEVANASMHASHGGKAAVAGDGSVRITATSIKLTAGANHNLSINGGTSSNGDYADMTASESGAATLSAKAGVTLTATTGDFTATAGNNLKIYGGSEVAESDSLHATAHGVVGLTADTSVNISGNHVNLAASGSSLRIFGGDDAAYTDTAKASNAATATLSAKSGVNINAKSGFTANLNGSAPHGYIFVEGGARAGFLGAASAFSNGKVSISGDATVNIKATAGGITIKDADTHASGGSVKVFGGSEAASDAFTSASDAGVATVTGQAGVHFSATGNISITDTNYELEVYGGDVVADNGSVNANGNGAKATVTGDASVTLKAAGSVTLGAGTYMSLAGGNQAVYGASGAANSGGTAKLIGTSLLTITAGTTFAAKAGGDLSIFGGASVDRNDLVTATGAKTSAQITGQGNVSISAKGAVSLNAGTASNDTLMIYGRQDVAYNAKVNGDSGGLANLDAESKVSIKAGGALTAGAGGSIDISAGNGAASSAAVNGINGSAKLTADASVALSATGNLTLTLTGHNFNVDGGSAGGRRAVITGSHSGGKATLGVNQSVSLTATGALSENGANNVNLLAGLFAATGTDALVNLTAPGTAAATVNSGITIKGSSVNVHQTGTLTKTPQTGLSSNGLIETGKITVTGSPVHLSFALQKGALTAMTLELLPSGTTQAGTSIGAGSFGGQTTLGSTPGTDFSTVPAQFHLSLTGTGLQLPGSEPATLSTLLGDGIIMSLLPVTFGTDAGLPATRGTDSADFTPAQGVASVQGSSGCAVMLLRDDGSRCRIRRLSSR